VVVVVGAVGFVVVVVGAVGFVVVVVGAVGLVVVVVGAGHFGVGDCVVVVVGVVGFVVVVVGVGRRDGLPGLATGVEKGWAGEADETVTGAAAHPLTITLPLASPPRAATK